MTEVETAVKKWFRVRAFHSSQTVVYLLLVDDWNCWSSITIQQLDWFPKLFRISSWDTLHIIWCSHFRVGIPFLVWLLVLIIEIRSVPWLVFEITLIACVIPAFRKGNSFFLGKNSFRNTLFHNCHKCAFQSCLVSSAFLSNKIASSQKATRSKKFLRKTKRI